MLSTSQASETRLSSPVPSQLNLRWSASNEPGQPHYSVKAFANVYRPTTDQSLAIPDLPGRDETVEHMARPKGVDYIITA
jgi:hypothetical protein